MPHVSFIVPAHDEEVCLPRTVRSIHEAARAAGIEYEIIVVDDASADRTGEVARAEGARVERVELRQIAAVRNAGARVARGDLFVFVDADTAVPPATLRAALRALEKPRVVGGGCAVAFDGALPLYVRFILPPFLILMRLGALAAGCFVFCRRSAFEAVGGFDEQYFASEEIWFSQALKRQGRFVVLRHKVITSGRKLRQYSARELFWPIIKWTLRGPRAVQQREGLDLWYRARRESSLPAEDRVGA